MKKITALIVALLIAFTAVPAHADDNRYYGESATRTAKHIGCKHIKQVPKGTLVYDEVTCVLHGFSVFVITTKDEKQNRQWNMAAQKRLPKDFYWASGHGAKVLANNTGPNGVPATNGSMDAALWGVILLPGQLWEGKNV